MKKVYLLGAIPALLLASCANDEVVKPPVNNTSEAAIAFNMGVRNIGRATTDDLTTVMNNFGVWAVKANNDDAFKDLTLNLGDTDNLDPQVVMDNYRVQHVDGLDAYGSDWTYLPAEWSTGAPSLTQYLKYWDGAYTSTYFFAYGPWKAATDNFARFDNTVPSLTFPTIQVSADPTLNFVYSAAQIETNATHIAATTSPANSIVAPLKVPLTFNRLLSQVKIAVYELIPGYTVELLNVEFTGETVGIKAIPADYNDAATPKWSRGSYVAEGAATVTYSGTGYATNTVAYTGATTSGANLTFEIPAAGTDIGDSYAAKTDISTVYNVIPNNPTAGVTDGDGNAVAPNSGLQFVLNYKLKSVDTNEEITVKGARVYVEPTYTAWAPNTVYTYVFCITKNSTGTTTGTDPDNKPDDAPDALYPIIFYNINIVQADANGVKNEWDINPATGVTNPHKPDVHNP